MAVTPQNLVKAFHEGEISFGGAAQTSPEIAWLAIVELSRQSLSNKQIEVLAAGPLEDLLAYHGAAFIDRIEKESRVYRAFRDLLGGVWRSSISDEVWRRVEFIRAEPW
jgi:hypothetical protein